MPRRTSHEARRVLNLLSAGRNVSLRVRRGAAHSTTSGPWTAILTVVVDQRVVVDGKEPDDAEGPDGAEGSEEEERPGREEEGKVGQEGEDEGDGDLRREESGRRVRDEEKERGQSKGGEDERRGPTLFCALSSSSFDRRRDHFPTR